MKPHITSLFLVCFASLSLAQEENWQLANGKGQRVPPNILEVTGDGTGTAVWQSEPVPVQPGGVYRFSFSHRGVDTSGGCLPCGIEGFTRDFSTTSNQWTEESFYFCRLFNSPPVSMRVGQWESNGTFQFRNVKLELVTRIHKEFDLPGGNKLWLGEGETIQEGKYRFRSNFVGKGTNTQRPFLDSSGATFNSNRWCLSGGSRIHCLFRVATPFHNLFPMTGGKLTINVCYHTQGEGIVEARTGGKSIELARINKTGTQEITLPEDIFPTNGVLIEIRGLDGCYFQIDRLDFEASLPATHNDMDIHSLNLSGETLFATGEESGRDILVLTQKNEINVVETDRATGGLISKILTPIETSRSPGEREMTFEFDGRKYSLTTQTHPLERSDYGYWIGDHWWCEADWKVSRDRPFPDITNLPKPISISAAKNDVEGFQFILRANKGARIAGLTGSVTELKGPNGAIIPAENVELLYVYYHFVHSRTDDTGLISDWPDALPPLDHPIDIPAGKNQPIWVNVKVPTDATAGNYQGTFHLKSADGKIDLTVLYTLHVWNFALPKQNNFETAYGYSPQH